MGRPSRELTTEELLRSWREDQDGKARSALVQRFTPAVISIAGRYARRGSCFEDLRSAGFIGLLTAIDRWRPEGGAAFLTYALQWIRSYVRGEWLRELSGGFVGVQLAFRRQREDLPVRVDCDWILASPAPDPLDQVIGSEAAEVLERIMAIAGLQERDREILRRHESGETFGAIGADWGLSREGARLREGQARTRLMLASRSIDPCYTSP